MDNFASVGIFHDQCKRVIIFCGDGGDGKGADGH
jgi:hypothetical protein